VFIKSVRPVLFYEYEKGNNAASAFKNICATCGEGSLTKNTCRKWFTRFREGNFNLSDESRPGRPSNCNEEAIRSHLSKNTRQSTSELAEASGISKSTVHYNLKYHIHWQKSTCWQHVFPCFHDTRDKKWISYNNVVRKRSWS